LPRIVGDYVRRKSWGVGKKKNENAALALTQVGIKGGANFANRTTINPLWGGEVDIKKNCPRGRPEILPSAPEEEQGILKTNPAKLLHYGKNASVNPKNAN